MLIETDFYHPQHSVVVTDKTLSTTLVWSPSNWATTCNSCPIICESFSLNASATMYRSSDLCSLTAQYLTSTTATEDLHLIDRKYNYRLVSF